MAKTLTITDERVKEAAAHCPDAKRVLEKLFPDTFVPQDEYMLVPNELGNTKDPCSFSVDGQPLSMVSVMARRCSGNFVGKGVYLACSTSTNKAYLKLEWSIVKDNEGMSVLVAKIIR